MRLTLIEKQTTRHLVTIWSLPQQKMIALPPDLCLFYQTALHKAENWIWGLLLPVFHNWATLDLICCLNAKELPQILTPTGTSKATNFQSSGCLRQLFQFEDNQFCCNLHWISLTCPLDKWRIRTVDCLQLTDDAQCRYPCISTYRMTLFC